MKCMKLLSPAVFLFLGCLFFMTVQGAVEAKRAMPAASPTAQEQSSPKIFNARLKGSKIIITGENFGPGTVVLIDGQAVKTNVDSESPSTLLVAKKIHKVTQLGEEVRLEARTAGGQTSDPFDVFLGQTIAIADNLQTLNLKVGERFMLILKKEPYQWTPTVLNPAVLEKVQDSTMPGSQGIFEAKRAGSTQLNAIGEIPCTKAEPPCLPAAAELFSINIVVSQ
jgi:hypothetical protein